MSIVWIEPHLNHRLLARRHVVVMITAATDEFCEIGFLGTMKDELIAKYGEKPFCRVGYARKENCLALRFSRIKMPDYRTCTRKSGNKIRLRFNFSKQFGINQKDIIGGYREMRWDKNLNMYIIPLEDRTFA